MMPSDFVYNQIFKGATNKGATNAAAHKFATIGLNSYIKHSFKATVPKLIEAMIKDAIKESKQTRR
jgi:hypothetical protein